MHLFAVQQTASGATFSKSRVSPASPERASGFPRAAVLGERALFAWTDAAEPARIRVAAAELGR